MLVGPNGAGKSNLLDVIRFLGDSARTDLVPALEARGGYHRVRYRGNPSGAGIDINVHATVTQHSSPTALDEYLLTFRQRAISAKERLRSEDIRRLIFREESFRFKRTRGRGRRVTIHGRDVKVIETGPRGQEAERNWVELRNDSLGLATLPKLSETSGGAEIEKMAQLFSSFRVFEVDVAAARRPARRPEWLDVEEALFAQEGPPVTLDSDGSNLAAFLLSLRGTEAFEDLVSDARAIVPGLLDLKFVPVGGSQQSVAVELRENGLRGTTSLADASFGTIRALALLALLYDPAPPALTCVEEVDHGLHPYALDLIVDRLREASARTQFMIATHSPTLVNRLRPNELIVCERGVDGASMIPAIEPDSVRRMEKAADGKLRLGELWFSGALGGGLG